MPYGQSSAKLPVSRHPLISLSCYPIIQSSCHSFIWSSHHSIIPSCGHPVIPSSHNHVISTCPLTDGLTHNSRIYRSASQTIIIILNSTHLEVWHVNIDEAVQELQGPEAVVAAGVVDDGHPEAALHRQRDGLYDLRHHVLRRHKVDVVTFGLVLQLQHEVCNFLRLQLPPILLL